MFGAMFQGANFFDIFLCNIVLAAVWCMVAFIACVKLPTSFFSFEKKRYQPKKWERNGRWYKDHLRIHKWKDRLPQFNLEFDKRHLATPSPAYLRQFLEVTCHAEVIHELIALLGFLSLFFCLLCEHPQDWLPLFFGIALFIGLCNLPFAAIQRYNRFRLVRLLRRMEAKTQVRS